MNPQGVFAQEDRSLLPWSGTQNVAAAVFCFATISLARFVIETPSDGITFLYVIPTALLALQFGLRGVIVGTLAGFALFVGWEVLDGANYSVGVPGFIIRPFVYAGPAVLIAIVAESRARARAELADSASLLAAIAEATPDTLYAKDADGRYLLINTAGAAASNHTPEEVVGHTDAELLPPEAAMILAEADAEVASLVAPIEVTAKLDLGRGRRVLRAMRGPLFAADESFRGHFGLVRDVTDEHRHEDYYRIQHRIAERLVEAPSLEELPDVVLGELVEADDVQWAAYWAETKQPGRFRCLAAAGEDIGVEVGDERELGGVPRDFHVSWRGARAGGSGSTALIRAPGAGVAMVAYREMPDQETIEAVFKPTMLMVSNYVERTRMATEADRTKNEFFGLISHELRTPLTSIIGYVELLGEVEAETLSPQAKRFIEVIDRNARRELRLVQDLLFLVRVEGGTFTLEREPTDLRSLIHESCEIVRPQAEAKGVRIVTDLEETGEVSVDPHRIGQAIDNLLTNAVKFSDPEREVTVRLRVGDGEAAIEVADQGIGVPEDELDKLFDRLFRASGAISNQIQGTGLGLTIVKSVVEAHGGSVGVESTQGVGTTFTIHLPIAQAAPDTAAIEARDEEFAV